MGRAQRLRMFPDVASGDERLTTDGMRLLASASHDLRQPLQAIGLWVELLQERIPEAETRRVLDRIQDTARSAEHVVDGLLDIARLDMGAVTTTRSTFRSTSCSSSSPHSSDRRHVPTASTCACAAAPW